MNVYYSDRYTVPLPDGHRFPMHKYRLIRLALLESGAVRPDELVEPEWATRADLLRAHSVDYVDAMLDGTLDAKAIRRLGFPWSQALVARSLSSVGGCIQATRSALRDGIAGNLAGGTHHALPDAGEGFCVFNDIAVALLRLLDEGAIRRAAVVDLDVHQGNGTAAILAADPRIFLLDVFGAKNYPFVKVPATRDVPLADGTDDAAYLQALDRALPEVLAFRPDLIVYQAGVDPLAQDALGRLSLSHDGLAARDWRVLSLARDAGIPISLCLGGGYARPIDPTILAHVNTYRTVREVFGDT